MKNLFTTIFFAAFAGMPVVSRAADNEQKVEAPISAVVVYLTGAEISHQKTVTLQPGRNELHFVGLTSKLVPKSIQFAATGEVSVLAISNRIDYLFGQKKNDARIQQLEDSLTLMSDNLDITHGQIEAYEKEKQMLDANQRIGGSDKGVVPADLKLTADFYVQRITEINTELVKLRRKAVNQEEIVNRLSWQVREANQRTNPPMGEIIVLVTNAAAAKIESNIVLRYVCSSAGWAPSYDLVAEDVGKPIDLKYRAKVFNNTDVAWKNVKMRLSTSDPMRSAAAPILQKWTLNFESSYNYNAYQQQQYNYDYNAPAAAPQTLESQNLANSAPPRAADGRGEAMKYSTKGAYSDDFGGRQDYQQPQQQYNQIQVSELSAEFDIKAPYDIPADGKPYIVDVTAYNLNATFKYHCVPKMEREAFLLARITGWEELDLVEGPANVYFGGTYVGQSYIYTRSVNDTLDLSFGRDQKLVVTRTKLKEFNNEKTAGTTKKETYSFEINVKNTRKTSVLVELQDQVPVSQDAEIIVETPELSKGELDPATGIVTWNMNIPPGETQKVVLTYTVKYPKSKSVKTKKYRSTAAPKF